MILQKKTDNLFLYVLMLIPDAETQLMFNYSFYKNILVSFDSWATDRKTSDNQLDYQIDTSSAQNINSPKYLKLAHQTVARRGVPNKRNIFEIFDNPEVGKYFVDIDGLRSPGDGVTIDYASND